MIISNELMTTDRRRFHLILYERSRPGTCRSCSVWCRLYPRTHRSGSGILTQTSQPYLYVTVYSHQSPLYIHTQKNWLIYNNSNNYIHFATWDCPTKHQSFSTLIITRPIMHQHIKFQHNRTIPAQLLMIQPIFPTHFFSGGHLLMPNSQSWGSDIHQIGGGDRQSRTVPKHL